MKQSTFAQGGVFLAAALEGLPGESLWQPYLSQTVGMTEKFGRNPLEALGSLLPASPLELVTDTIRGYGELLLFLLLLMVLEFLVGDTADCSFLDLVAAGGCGVLVWGRMMELADSVCEKMTFWKQFLVNFLPICGGVLAAGGEVNAGAAASGFLLGVLCLLAQGTVLCIRPLLQSYLALSMACCIHSERGLSDACRMSGKLLRKGLVLFCRGFSLLLGLQRVITLQLDRTNSRLGRLLTSSVPVIGQALSGAADTVLAGLQLLKSSLGVAALLLLGAEFLPLYVGLLLHLAVLAGCGLLCGFAGIEHCRALFACLAEAVRCMAAVTALFFSITVVGVVLLMAVQGG